MGDHGLLGALTEAALAEAPDDQARIRRILDRLGRHDTVDLCLFLSLGEGPDEAGAPRCDWVGGAPSLGRTLAEALFQATRAASGREAGQVARAAACAGLQVAGIGALACEPVTGRDAALRGLLAVSRARGPGFTPAECALFRAAGGILSLALRAGDAAPPAPPPEELPVAALDAAPAAIWLTDARGRFVLANARYRALFEGPPDAGLRERWWGLVLPEEIGALEAAFAEAFAARSPFRHRVRIRHPAQGLLSIQAEAEPLLAPDGRFLGYCGIATDATEVCNAAAAIREAESQARILFEAAPFSVIVIDPATHAILDANDFACAEYGYSHAEFLQRRIGDIDALRDPDAIRRRGRAHTVRPGTQEFEAQHRRKSGAIRDVLVRVHGVRLNGRDVSYGAHFDITERKAATAKLQLLAQELDHRAKNILAVVQAMLRLTPMEDPQAFVRAVEGRLGALARAHAMLAETRWESVDLRALLEGELAPFLTEHRVDLDGPGLLLPPRTVQPLSMAVHELATNAVKYGALSVPAGRIAIAWTLLTTDGPRLRLRWREAGGPPVLGAPHRRGFGSRVLEGTVRSQLGGSVALDWGAGGLACAIEIPLGAPDTDNRAA